MGRESGPGGRERAKPIRTRMRFAHEATQKGIKRLGKAPTWARLAGIPTQGPLLPQCIILTEMEGVLGSGRI